MSADVIPFPRRVCALCGEPATQSIELVNEYGHAMGHKHLCDEYPFCAPHHLLEPPQRDTCG